MVSNRMEGVREEAERIWESVSISYKTAYSGSGPSIYLGDGTRRYSEHNVDTWLANWHLFSQKADQRFSWAMLRADVLKAVEKCRPRVQEFFLLYCVEGYTLEEIADEFHCQIETCERYWRWLREDVMHVLTDYRVKAQPIRGKGSMPTGRYFGTEGQFYEPIAAPPKIT